MQIIIYMVPAISWVRDVEGVAYLGKLHAVEGRDSVKHPLLTAVVCYQSLL
jgi:hypothetical protein